MDTSKVVQAFIVGLQYSKSEVFEYLETHKEVRDKDNRINFSTLMYIKQKDLIPNARIMFHFVHIVDEPMDDRAQTLKHIELDVNIPLYEVDVAYNRNGIARLVMKNDQWTIRRAYKTNFTDVPTDGPGTYAIAVILKTETEEGEASELLDVYTFDVI